MISTFPCTQSVTAFCQWTILRGSYVAFRRSVCSMSSLPEACDPRMSTRETNSLIVDHAPLDCQGSCHCNTLVSKGLALWLAVGLAALTVACGGRSAVPRPFPTPGGTARSPTASPASPLVESVLRTAT